MTTIDHPSRSGTSASVFEDGVLRVKAGATPESVAADLIQNMTPEERLGLLDGDEDFWPGLLSMLTTGYNRVPIVHGEVARLGIPGLRFSDGPRGVVMGQSTAFPVSMARGATWDIALEEQVGAAIGLELRAQGANFFGGVCINLPRHPAWGRAQETYGEDPILLGELGAACVRGVQKNAMAVAKHFALNSMENARFWVNVTADDAALNEVYLAHFRRVVEEGVAGIMTSYNSVNGEWAGQNAQLMEGVLRSQWGFAGVTVSDFIWGLRDAAKSLRAGLDVEEPFRQQRTQHLPASLENGDVSWDDVDRAAVRIIATQLRFYASVETPTPSIDVVFSRKHRDLARTVAARSVVLLKNEIVDGAPVLPLDESRMSRVAVIGRLANLSNTGDHGSSDVRSPSVVTALEGLRAALPNAEIDFIEGDDPRAAAEAAARADVAIIVAGYTAEDEGEYVSGGALSDPNLARLFPPSDGVPEAATLLAGLTDENLDDSGGMNILGSAGIGGDRASLRLRDIDAQIIRAVGAANNRTVVSIVAGSAVITEEWRDSASAVLLGWYAGAEGGHALADVLLGRVDASGRLPFSIPTDESHLPYFDRDATEITYDKWFGQRLLDKLGKSAAFPLGFGLSYTSFELSGVDLARSSDEYIEVTVTVSNTGARDGRHVVQVYGVPSKVDDFPSRVLLGFTTVEIPAGASVQAKFSASLRPLKRWTSAGFAFAADNAVIEVSGFAGDPSALTSTLELRHA